MTIENQEPPIQKLYGFSTLIVNKNKCLEFEKTQPKPTIKMISDTALVGIEIEVENIQHDNQTICYWSSKADGSLRNYGIEFVSTPLRGYQVPYALEHLKTSTEINDNPVFSPRTSVHVHLNVRDMTWNQIKCFILLYAIFERHFFSIAGTKREESIFCVPLYKTNQLSFICDLENNTRHWYKYSAINCATILGNDELPKFGTIEFRHLYGTIEPEIICNWINNIFLLRDAAYQFNFTQLLDRIKIMNTTSEYIGLYQQIFKDKANLRMMHKRDFEYCITQLKLQIWGNNIHYYSKDTSALMQFMYKKNKELHKKPNTNWKELYLHTIDPGFNAMQNTNQAPIQIAGEF